MHFRKYQEEDSFHKKEIVEKISKELNREPIINSRNFVVWTFNEKEIGILMELNPLLACPAAEQHITDIGYAWMLELFNKGINYDRVGLDDNVYRIPFIKGGDFGGETVTYENYLKSFIDIAKIRLG